MLYWIFVGFVVLHGLAHLVYVGFARGWIVPENGQNWTERSWLFTPIVGEEGTRKLGSWIFYVAVGLFVVAGLAYALHQDWALLGISVAAIYSFLAIVVMWDRKFDHLTEKGLLGLLINAGLLAAVWIFHFPEI